jgi:hypothetical protein
MRRNEADAAKSARLKGKKCRLISKTFLSKMRVNIYSDIREKS